MAKNYFKSVLGHGREQEQNDPHMRYKFSTEWFRDRDKNFTQNSSLDKIQDSRECFALVKLEIDKLQTI